MKLTITAPEDQMTRYMIEVFASVADGMTSGHVDAGTYWDFGEKEPLTPEAVAELLVAGISFQHNAHIYSPEQLSALLMLAVKEARR